MFVLQSLKPDTEKLQHEMWSAQGMMNAEGPWVREQFARLEQLIASACPQRNHIGETHSGGRVPRIELPKPKAWKRDIFRGIKLRRVA